MSEELNDLLKEYRALAGSFDGWPSSIDHKNALGEQPINCASWRGLEEEISLLVDEGADINNQGEHGYSPLHYAVEFGRLAVAKQLVKLGADIFVTNSNHFTPKELAEALEESEIFDFLSQVEKNNPL